MAGTEASCEMAGTAWRAGTEAICEMAGAARYGEAYGYGKIAEPWATAKKATNATAN
jgi:hypothetical protein